MLQHVDVSELVKCAACNGSGKNRRPFKGRCFRCNGDKKFTVKKMQYMNWVSKLLE